MIAFLISRPMKRVGLILPPAILAHANSDGANWFVACPFRLKRIGFVMSAVCPVYPGFCCKTPIEAICEP
jgi:hypothetical protein